MPATGIHCHLLHACLLLAALTLAACGGGPEAQALAAYEKSRDAIAAGDLEALRSLVAGEHAKELEGPGAAMALEIARSAMPQDIRLVEATLANGEVTLTLAGRSILGDDANKLSVPAEGSVRMIEEADGWKIASEDWNMALDRATPIFDVQPFMREGQRPVALKVLEGHASGATRIVHTPSWRQLVTISHGDFSLRVWDVQTGEQVAMRTLESRPTSLALDADAQSVLTADVEGDVIRWPLDALGELGAGETILEGAGQHAVASPDGRWLAVTSHDAPVVIYDAETLAAVRTLEGSEKLRSTAFSPSGELLAGSEGNELLIWDTKKWSAKTYDFDDVSPDSPNGLVSWSADGRYLGVPCGDSSIIVFDVEKRRVKHDFFVSNVAALSLEFSPDGSLFATAQDNQQINLWSMDDHRRVGYILSKKANATALHFSPDGRSLIAGHDDREIVFWGVARAGETAVAPRRPQAAAAHVAKARRTQKPERITLLSQTNYLDNPNANQQQRFWRTSGDAGVEECAPGNPCFVTRWDGDLVGTATLPADAAGRYMLLIGSASAERAHAQGSDQTGEAYIHGYGEGLDPNGGLGKHYSARTLITRTREADTWSTLWGVFPVGEGIRKLSFEIRQADGSSAKTGSASRFDDLGVYLFDTEQQAKAFVARYEREVGRVMVASAQRATPSDDAASQPPASPAPETTAPDTGRSADPGATITSCQLSGRTVFMSKAQCAQQGGR
jgi:WD40 repeat protein